jgi:hypothetical protein
MPARVVSFFRSLRVGHLGFDLGITHGVCCPLAAQRSFQLAHRRHDDDDLLNASGRGGDAVKLHTVDHDPVVKPHPQPVQSLLPRPKEPIEAGEEEMVSRLERVKERPAPLALEHRDFGRGGRAFLRMMAVFAELERDMIRERTRAGMNCPEVKAKMASRKTRGKLTGCGGIGYVTKGARGRKYREEHPGEQAAIQLIIAWREAEKMSWSEIALRLMREKHLTKDGRMWQPWRCRMAYLSVRQPEVYERQLALKRQRQAKR